MSKKSSFHHFTAWNCGNLSTVIWAAVVCSVCSISLLRDSEARCGQTINVFRDPRNDCGLTDLRGRELVPAIYPSIDYFGYGLFVISLREPGKRQSFSNEKLLVNSKGVKLKFELPEGTFFSRVLWVGEKTEGVKNYVLDDLPDDCLIVFRTEQNFGICDKNGEVFLPASYAWIGTAREGKVVVRDGEAHLFVVDLKTKEQKKVQCEDTFNGSGMTFCDGLASFHGKTGYGFIDAGGKVAIEPKCNWAYAFNSGRAWVTFLAEDPKFATGAFIDKSGNVVSPSNLKVSESFGGLAVAWNSVGKAGIVNRDFEFVVKPEYDVLIPQPSPTFSEEDIWSRHSKPPLFYYASKKKGREPLVISTTGQVLFALPEGVHLPNWPPYLNNGVIVCPVGKDSPNSEVICLNLKGQKIGDPYALLAKDKRISFRQIAPGILLKTVKPPNVPVEGNPR